MLPFHVPFHSTFRTRVGGPGRSIFYAVSLRTVCICRNEAKIKQVRSTKLQGKLLRHDEPPPHDFWTVQADLMMGTSLPRFRAWLYNLRARGRRAYILSLFYQGTYGLHKPQLFRRQAGLSIAEVPSSRRPRRVYKEPRSSCPLNAMGAGTPEGENRGFY